MILVRSSAYHPDAPISYRLPELGGSWFRRPTLSEWRLTEMEKSKVISADVMAIVAEENALSFVTRKEWRELPEFCLGELKRFEIVRAFKGTTDVYFLLWNLDPFAHLANGETSFRLVRISTDEETGKQVFHVMDLSTAEGSQLHRDYVTLWD